MSLTPTDWTVSGLSVELGIDRRTIGKKIANVAPVRIDGKSKYYRMADVVAAIYVNVSVGPTDGTKEDNEARLVKAKADEKELQVARLKGELIPTDEAKRRWASYIAGAKARLLSLPSKLAPAVIGVDKLNEVKNILSEGVRDVLTELSTD
jgi:hypothetical protein